MIRKNKREEAPSDYGALAESVPLAEVPEEAEEEEEEEPHPKPAPKRRGRPPGSRNVAKAEPKRTPKAELEPAPKGKPKPAPKALTRRPTVVTEPEIQEYVPEAPPPNPREVMMDL